MTLAEIEQAIAELPSQDYNRFREWFEEFDAQLWDKQIEDDAKSGRLDKLIAEVEKEINDLSVIEERRNEPERPLREYLHKRKFGSAKGKIKFAEDFDEPLEDFHEYMPNENKPSTNSDHE